MAPLGPYALGPWSLAPGPLVPWPFGPPWSIGVWPLGPFGPLGLGGGAGCLRPVEATKARLGVQLAERRQTEIIYMVVVMRVAYNDFYR